MAKRSSKNPPAAIRPSPTDAYDIQFFRRHPEDDPTEPTPAREVINGWPPQLQARVRAVIIDVAKAPPPRFSGGGMWEVMHDDMAGFCEVRIRFKDTLYRVFCVLDPAPAMGDGTAYPQNVLTIIDAADKPNRTAMPSKVYSRCQRYRSEYLDRTPRNWA